MLERRSEFEWLVPPRGRMRVPGLLFASEPLLHAMDDKVLEQVTNVATLPGIQTASMAMPDAHWGYGLPVGGVVATGRGRAADRRQSGLRASAHQYLPRSQSPAVRGRVTRGRTGQHPRHQSSGGLSLNGEVASTNLLAVVSAREPSATSTRQPAVKLRQKER